MRRLLTALALLLAVTLSTLAGSVAPAQAFVDRDCSDFATQAEAQAFFLAAGPGDPHRLDAEGDGLACESNPCPCTGSAPVPLVGRPPARRPRRRSHAGERPGRLRQQRSRPAAHRQRRQGHRRRHPQGPRPRRRRARRTHPRHRHPRGLRPARVRRPDASATDGSASHRSAPAWCSTPTRARRTGTATGAGCGTSRASGRDVGRAQVRAGLATTYVYRDNPFARTREYRTRGGPRTSVPAGQLVALLVLTGSVLDLHLVHPLDRGGSRRRCWCGTSRGCRVGPGVRSRRSGCSAAGSARVASLRAAPRRRPRWSGITSVSSWIAWSVAAGEVDERVAAEHPVLAPAGRGHDEVVGPAGALLPHRSRSAS